MISTKTTKPTATRKSTRSKKRQRGDAARKKVPTTDLSKRSSATNDRCGATYSAQREQTADLLRLAQPPGGREH